MLLMLLHNTIVGQIFPSYFALSFSRLASSLLREHRSVKFSYVWPKSFLLLCISIILTIHPSYFALIFYNLTFLQYIQMNHTSLFNDHILKVVIALLAQHSGFKAIDSAPMSILCAVARHCLLIFYYCLCRSELVLRSSPFREDCCSFNANSRPRAK